MNTSLDQLHEAYASCYSEDICETMKLVHKHFHTVMEQNDDQGEILFNAESLQEGEDVVLDAVEDKDLHELK